MPRPLRVELAGGVYHVFARGAVKQTIYLDTEDRERYLRTLGRVTRWMSWRCLAYCLMGNHVHLLIETPKPNLADGMQRLHGAYAQAFNQRHGKSGHVFEKRYGGRVINSDPHLWVVASYIARNPVEAGFCKAPEDWPWGSHQAIANATPPPWLDASRLLSYFEAMGGDPHERYLEYVAVANIKGLAL
jgi:REP element-mobilizing transposase RayT